MAPPHPIPLLIRLQKICVFIKALLTAGILLSASEFLIAQTIPTPKIIRFLLQHPRSISIITGNPGNIIPPSLLPKEIQNEFRYLLKTDDQLFCGINGTGMLFEVKDSSGYLNIKRYDKTFFSGANFGAVHFALQKDIYSFGGYGFWKFNGILRQFNYETRDWYNEQLQREIKGVFIERCWIDELHQKIYIEDPLMQSEAFISYPPVRLPTPQLQVINISNGEVTTMGNLSYSPENGLQTPWGKLNFDDGKATLRDYVNNRMLTGKEGLDSVSRKISNRKTHFLSFMIDSTLYFGNTELPSFDSIPLSINQFKDTGNRIYKIKFPIENAGYIYGIFLLPIALLATLFYYNRRKYKNAKKESKEIVPETRQVKEEQTRQLLSKEELFSAIEASLIRFLLQKNQKNQTATVDEVNKLLGLSSKNEAIQKKNRSGIIHQINQKWSVRHGKENPLIERHRSAFDRRSIEYFVSPFWQKKAEEWISKNN